MKKLGLKLAIVLMAMVAAVVGVILVVVMNSATSLTTGLMAEQAGTAGRSFESALEGYKEQALERAEMIAESGDVVNAVLSGDTDKLRSVLNSLSVGMDLITLCDAEGNVLARTHNDKTGDSVLSQKAISVALSTGKGIKTIESGTVIGLSTRGSAAIKDSNGNIIGALTCGHDLSQPKYVDMIKAQNDCEATFFAGDTRMNTTIIDESGNRVLNTKASDTVIEKVLNKGEVFNTRIPLFGKTYQAHYSPVVEDGKVIGILFAGVMIDDALSQQRNVVILIIIAGIMLVIAIAVTAIIISWTTKKIYWYEGMLDSIPFPVSVTDMNMNWTFINKPVEQMLNVRRADVLGKQCSNWGAGICKTGNCGINCLRNGKDMTTFEQAGMTFRVDVSYLADARGKKVGHVEIVQDISKMIDTQNEQARLIEHITEVSGTFITGTKQIADGAQALSQGSTEQAAAVEQLSASISDIAEKTKNNAQMAKRASSLAGTIKQNAEKGSSQMEQMTSAVKEINDASQSIGKVIKVIDDIAFQTNILALNAAVEAARAGQHGKGFAVVAEEVRNLAAKSAEAAKDTGALIANSMEKAEFGARIAGETAASLAEIVSGINESNRIVGDIATSSEEQSEGINEINKGIGQVAQVIQQNSATAEESAAASAELSVQSDALARLVNGTGTDIKRLM